jgi:hypothetical protein
MAISELEQRDIPLWFKTSFWFPCMGAGVRRRSRSWSGYFPWSADDRHDDTGKVSDDTHAYTGKVSDDSDDDTGKVSDDSDDNHAYTGKVSDDSEYAHMSQTQTTSHDRTQAISRPKKEKITMQIARNEWRARARIPNSNLYYEGYVRILSRRIRPVNATPFQPLIAQQRTLGSSMSMH